LTVSVQVERVIVGVLPASRVGWSVSVNGIDYVSHHSS
jgi:hypothetical protein